MKLHRSTESICHRTETTEDYVLPLGAATAGYSPIRLIIFL